MQVDTTKLKGSTKSLLTALVAAGALFQIPVVHDGLLKFGELHPHWAGVIGTVLGIYGVLHDPQVQGVLAAFGIRRGSVGDTQQ